MLVDVEVARRLDRQIERAMPRDELQHVIEEADAGRHVVAARGLRASASGGSTFRASSASITRAAHRTSSSAAISRRVSSTTPAVMRMQPSQPGSLRAVAHADAARGERVDDEPARGPTRTSTKFAALGQVRSPSRSQASVQQRAAMLRLGHVPVAVVAVLERRRERRGGTGVQAVRGTTCRSGASVAGMRR